MQMLRSQLASHRNNRGSIGLSHLRKLSTLCQQFLDEGRDCAAFGKAGQAFCCYAHYLTHVRRLAGIDPTGLPQQEWGVTTRKGNVLYLHVFDSSSGKVSVQMADFKQVPSSKKSRKLKIRSVTALNGGAALTYNYGKDGALTVNLPSGTSGPDYVIAVSIM